MWLRPPKAKATAPIGHAGHVGAGADRVEAAQPAGADGARAVLVARVAGALEHHGAGGQRGRMVREVQRQRQPGRPAAHDDEVVLRSCHVGSPFSSGCFTRARRADGTKRCERREPLETFDAVGRCDRRERRPSRTGVSYAPSSPQQGARMSTAVPFPPAARGPRLAAAQP